MTDFLGKRLPKERDHDLSVSVTEARPKPAHRTT